MQLLIATTNPGKVREFHEMLAQSGLSFSDLSAHPGTTPVEETGYTFRANACLKASHYARLFNTYAVADDSGLEVDALDGSPGVHSARWAELNQAGKGDAANNALLLRQLENVADKKRAGRFVCVLALADPQGRILLTARDTVEGRVLRAPRGSNGFGYDPLFFIDEMGKTTAELAPDEKHAISHRGKALRHLRGLMALL
jgi:XTP/dITP diphosphohydrolase